MVVAKDGVPVAPFRDGDALICFNYRSDRMRQMVRALTDSAFDGFPTRHPKIPVATMTSYDQTLSVPVAFPPQSMARIVAETLADHGRTTLRTAETEKYAHVTYFFNGGIEVPYAGEERILVPSQKVATYDLAPGDERAGHHRRALPRHRDPVARLHALQLRERRHGRTHGLDPGDARRRWRRSIAA